VSLMFFISLIIVDLLQENTQNSTAGKKQRKGKGAKRSKNTKMTAQRLASFVERATAILEDDECPSVECLTHEVGVQASMCSCDMSDCVVIVATNRYREVCLQTNLCHCSAYVDLVVNAANTHTTHLSSQQSSPVVQSVPDASGNLQVPAEISVERDTSEQSAVMVDIDDMCKEMEACDLDDTVQYDYTCEKPTTGDCAENQTSVAAGVEESASKKPDSSLLSGNVTVTTSETFDVGNAQSTSKKVALKLEPEISLSDSIIVTLADIGNDVGNSDVTAGALPDVRSDDAAPSFEDHSDKSMSFSTGVMANQSEPHPQPVYARRAGVLVVHSSGDLFSDDYEMTDGHAPLHTTRTGDKSLIDSRSTVVRGPVADQSDGSIHITVNDVSLQISPMDDEGLLPPTNTCPGSHKRSSCHTDSDMLDDEVFEPQHITTHTIPDVGNCGDDMSHLEIDAGVHNSLLEEAGEEVIVPRQRSLSDPSPTARKMLTSTAIASPEAISSFFGPVSSSTSGGDHDQSPKYSVGGGRRKSKPGRKRVSMCGEYDSPMQFFSPQRTPGDFACQLMTVADTDEEDSSALPNVLYTTANEGHVPDTETEDSSDGSDPDAPLDASEPPSSSKSKSASCGLAGTIGIGKHASTQPNLSDCSLDISSGSDLVFKPTVAFGAAKAGNRFEQNSLSVLLLDLFEIVLF